MCHSDWVGQCEILGRVTEKILVIVEVIIKMSEYWVTQAVVSWRGCRSM